MKKGWKNRIGVLISLIMCICLLCSCGILSTAKKLAEIKDTDISESAVKNEDNTGEIDTGELKNTQNVSDSEQENVDSNVNPENDLVRKMVGYWRTDLYGYICNGSVVINIMEDGNYKIDIFGTDYRGGNFSPLECTYSGRITTYEMSGDEVIVFNIDSSNDNSISESAGDFFVDRIIMAEEDTRILYMTQANNGDTVLSIYFDESRPVFYETTQEEAYEDYTETEDYADLSEKEAAYYYVENPSYEYYYDGDKKAELNFDIVLDEYNANDIIDTEDWFDSIGRDMPSFADWCDDKYEYILEETYDSEYPCQSILHVYDYETGEPFYTFDMEEYKWGATYGNTGFEDFIEQSIQYARIVDGVLYIATGHNTYSNACPETGYITAIDVSDGHVIWKTQAQVCNSHNFEFVDNCIVCGYGFTDEPDYLYVVSVDTGEVMTRLNVKNAVDYVYNDEGVLRVRCYSYNYEYHVEMLK